ncbi:MAG: peptidoglycan DD-metalloendopeptidase family protein [Solirubrobacterales bacterium]|nr:peptidoglycan DD-metalloendopeptidase family protein [Solirubrobacterales bacterium]
MHSSRRQLIRAAGATLTASVIALAAVFASAGSPVAHAASAGSLQQQISAGQSQISSLAGAVSAANGRLAQLNGSIAALQGQIAKIQADLDAKRAELLKLRGELTAARTRLAQLEEFEAHAESVLSQELINSYESDRPDIVTVVLESTGFQDLLERLAFVQRIRNQDVQIISQVRSARRAVAAQATRLGALEQRQQIITTQVLGERNTLYRAKVSLVVQQIAVSRAKAAKAGQLANARGQVAALQQQLAKIQTAQAVAQTGSSSGQSSPSVSAGQTVSSGGFTFPMPKGDASPPGTWSPDQGVDISAPGGTPELAVCSGTIVLHGIGGFGPWAPVLHCDNPIDGYSYVYYGHAGPANQLPVGTHVGAGEVMSEVGPGIVGISTGPHLELGFADSSGSPIGSQTAGTMLSLLQAAYAA